MAQTPLTGSSSPDSSGRDDMLELVTSIVRALVDSSDEVSVEAVESETATRFLVRTARADRGKVIGKQGRTAVAIRTLLGAVSVKLDHRYTLQIVEDEDPGAVGNEPVSPDR
jgi:uncharacterized protein